MGCIARHLGSYALEDEVDTAVVPEVPEEAQDVLMPMSYMFTPTPSIHPSSLSYPQPHTQSSPIYYSVPQVGLDLDLAAQLVLHPALKELRLPKHLERHDVLAAPLAGQVDVTCARCCCKLDWVGMVEGLSVRQGGRAS